MENLSAQKDLSRKLVEKILELENGTFGSVYPNIKKITEIPCLAHCSFSRQNTITMDASAEGLGATIWLQ